jgi:lysine 2,3-aminomutase
MRQHGQKTEGLISWHFRNVMINEEGTTTTLPFIQNVEHLSKYLSLDDKEKGDIDNVSHYHPLKIPEYYISIMDKDNPFCPIRKQSVPSGEELINNGKLDPLNEKGYSATPAFIKKYPGRGVFLVNAECAMYCRFCNRRRFTGGGWNPRKYWEETFRYIEKDEEIHEVILSGGDPFMLSPDELQYILGRLRIIERIKVIRISTRVPVVFPNGLHEDHLAVIKGNSPIWIVVHINHPKEITPVFMEKMKRFREAGGIIISQTVLLRGVNDCPYILQNLFENLIYCGIKPYYLFQLDEVRGAMHFKVKIAKGIEIMRFLRINTSGLALPHYVIDIPGGLGKVPVDYRYIKKRKTNKIHLEGFSATMGIYCDDGKKSRCTECGLCKKT